MRSCSSSFMRRGAVLLAAALLCMAALPARAQADALHVLVIGVDASPQGQRGRSDAMVLLRIHPGSGSVRAVSFLRDLYVSIPTVGRTRLNAAYHHGGAPLLRQVLQQHFGVEIDRTVTVDFAALIDVVDQLGGVEIEITQQELSHFNDIVLDHNHSHGLSGGVLQQAGTHRLDGKQALCYSRIRKLDSDFQRVSRQQRVMEALLAQLAGRSKWELARLAVANLGRLDTDLTLGDMARLLPMAAQLDTLTFEAMSVPFIGAFTEEVVDGMMVLKPDLAACRRKVQAFFQP